MEPVSQASLDELPEVVRHAGQLALERKAQDVLLLDLRGISTATDHFVIASGTSDIQVKAIADHILEDLRKEGVKPAHVEGLETGRWVLLDYIDFVVHVFHPQSRSFYQLEALWGDAPRHEMTEEAQGA
ncbi:MAG TPA: ribosome silencing factor [Longimicrobiales bacterium]|nr:ribosome silencing factor [Longimicrobiales bacterium]